MSHRAEVPETFGLSGRRCVVVGATGGLGQEIARTLSHHGMKLFVHGHTNERKLEDLLACDGIEQSLSADVRSVSDVEHLAKEVLRWADGRLDALVYAAGVNPTAAPMKDLEVEDWDNTLSVNLRGAFLTVKYLLPGLLASSMGSIVLVSSIYAVQSPANRAAYSASKHGLTAIVQTVSKEYGSGVRINALAAGPSWGRSVRRIFAEHVNERDISVEEYVKLRARQIPVRRFMEPAELASATLFLLSPLSSYINGQLIPITGGASQ